MSKTTKYLFYFLTLILINPAIAEISSENLPSMGNLAKLIGDTDQNEVNRAIHKQGGLISSGMIASDSARGTTAAEIASLLSGGSEKLKIQLRDAIMTERKQFEDFLTENKFAKNDMAVAYAVSFIILWEMSSRKELPMDGSIEAGKYLVHIFKSGVEQFYALQDTDKAKSYDWLMTTPIAFASLIKGFEKEGRTAEANRLREKSANLFVSLAKMPHDYFTISKQGKIGVDTDKLLAHKKKSDEGSDW